MSARDGVTLSAAHWNTAALLALALIIDIMKPASLGFVTPGMRVEYHIDQHTVGWLPFCGTCRNRDWLVRVGCAG